MVQEEGKCPKCGEEISCIDTEAKEVEENTHFPDIVYAEYKCGKCGFEGKAMYELSFKEHQTWDGEVVDG